MSKAKRPKKKLKFLGWTVIIKTGCGLYRSTTNVWKMRADAIFWFNEKSTKSYSEHSRKSCRAVRVYVEEWE